MAAVFALFFFFRFPNRTRRDHKFRGKRYAPVNHLRERSSISIHSFLDTDSISGSRKRANLSCNSNTRDRIPSPSLNVTYLFLDRRWNCFRKFDFTQSRLVQFGWLTLNDILYNLNLNKSFQLRNDDNLERKKFARKVEQKCHKNLHKNFPRKWLSTIIFEGSSNGHWTSQSSMLFLNLKLVAVRSQPWQEAKLSRLKMGFEYIPIQSPANYYHYCYDTNYIPLWLRYHSNASQITFTTSTLSASRWPTDTDVRPVVATRRLNCMCNVLRAPM